MSDIPNPLSARSVPSSAVSSSNACPSASPRRELTLFDSTCIIVGIIIGAGIYRSSPEIAGQTPNLTWLIGLWLLGGAFSLIGAVCYAELATAYPKEGGDYVYLTRAFGRPVGFLFAWCQLWIVRPGSIGMMAFAFAEYANEIYPRMKGPSATYVLAAYASASIVALTVVNLLGVKEGKWTQNILTIAKVLGLAAIVAVGFTYSNASSARIASPTPSSDFDLAKFGYAMLLVLFTYGGWNEMAFVSAEVKEPRKNILRALLLGTLSVTAIYVLVILAFAHALGLHGSRKPNRGRRRAWTGDRSLGGPGHQCVDLHLGPRGHQRPNLHRIENLLRDGQRSPPLFLAGPMGCPARRARPLAADPRSHHPGAGRLLRLERQWVPEDGHLHYARFLVFPGVGGRVGFCAALARTGHRPAVPRARLSRHSDPLLPLMRFHGLLHPGLCLGKSKLGSDLVNRDSADGSGGSGRTEIAQILITHVLRSTHAGGTFRQLIWR